MDWSRIEQQVHYQTQASLGSGQPAPSHTNRRSSGTHLTSAQTRGSSIERSNRPQGRDSRQESRDVDFSTNQMADSYHRDSRDSSIGVNNFPMITSDVSQGQIGSYSAEEIMREMGQMKQAMAQQQNKITVLEQKLSSFSKSVETNQGNSTDRFGALELTVNSITRQLTQGSRFEGSSTTEIGAQLKTAINRIDGLDSAVTKLIEDQVPKEMISQITKSIVISSKQLDQVVTEVRDISSRALKSSESVVSAILSQGDDRREYTSPKRLASSSYF
jgi:hypothetical protein